MNEDTIHDFGKEEEPEWMLEWRLKVYQTWLKMDDLTGQCLIIHRLIIRIFIIMPPPKAEGPKSLDEVDPELLRTYEKLGIPRRRNAGRCGG